MRRQRQHLVIAGWNDLQIDNLLLRIRSFLRSYWPDLLIIAVILGVALVFRLVNIEGWPRWYTDEGIYSEAGRNLYNGIIGLRGYEPNPGAPLYPMVSGFFTQIFGNSMFLARTISAVFGGLACVVVYLIAKKLYSRTAGMIAGFFLAVSYNAVYLDRMGFNPAMFDFFVALTLLSYFYLSKTEKNRWLILFGLAGAAALLTKLPQGGFVIFFAIVMALLDKKPKIFLHSLPIMVGIPVAVHFTLSFVNDFNLYWKVLLWFAQGLSYWPTDHWAFMRTLMMAHPVDQLHEQESMFHIGLWTTLGFVAMAYVGARAKRNDRLLVMLFFSLLLTILIPQVSYWWILLVGFLPLFALAIGRLLTDFIAHRKMRLLILPVILLLGLSEWGFAHPGAYGIHSTGSLQILQLWKPESRMIFQALLVFIVGIMAIRWPRPTITLRRFTTRIPVNSIARYLSIYFIIFIIAVNVPETIAQLNEDVSTDQRIVAEWINKNTKGGDLIGVPHTVLYLVKEGVVAVEPEYLHFYETGIPGPRIFAGRPLTIDAPLAKVKYVILDTSAREGSVSFLPFVSHIESTWKHIYSVGDFDIYSNPGTIEVVEVEEIIDPEMHGTWMVVEGGPDAMVEVVEASTIPDTPSEIQMMAKATYGASHDGMTRFRFIRDSTFNLAELTESNRLIQIWIYGDGSDHPIEVAWRDRNGYWKRIIEEPYVASLSWKGWKLLDIRIDKNALQQDDFDSTNTMGLELNVWTPGKDAKTSTIFIGPAKISEARTVKPT